MHLASHIDRFGSPDTATVHPNPFKIIFEPRMSEDMLRQMCPPDD